MSKLFTNNSLNLWQELGEYILMAMPYCDEILLKGKGCEIIDADGNKFLDLVSGQFCNLLGYNHPKFLEKITKQLKQIIHTGSMFLSEPVMKVAKKLAEITPGDLKCSLLLSTGTEANECALRIAKVYTKRTAIAGFTRGYFGISLATRSLTSISIGSTGYDAQPYVPESYQILSPHCFRCPVGEKFPQCDYSCLKISKEILGDKLEQIAAFIIEPIFSAGGMIIPPPGYLKKLRQLADDYGILIIADEAQTAFGRTGRWFGIEHHEIIPDILVFAKGAGNGLPVSGVVTTPKIAEKIANRGFIHLSSHQADPISASALSAVIDILEEENLVNQSEEKGRYFIKKLKELQKKWSIIADIRGKGLMIGMELIKNPDTMEPANELAPFFTYTCKKYGVNLNYTHFETVFRILPPLIITKEQIDFAISVFDKALEDIYVGKIKKEDILPQNRFSRALINSSKIKKLFYRLWETSPEYWLKKFKEKIK